MLKTKITDEREEGQIDGTRVYKHDLLLMRRIYVIRQRTYQKRNRLGSRISLPKIQINRN